MEEDGKNFTLILSANLYQMTVSDVESLTGFKKDGILPEDTPLEVSTEVLKDPIAKFIPGKILALPLRHSIEAGIEAIILSEENAGFIKVDSET